MIELVSPLGHPRVEAQAQRRTLATPVGRRVGFIWNQYPVTRQFWPLLERALEDLCAPTGVERAYKSNTWMPLENRSSPSSRTQSTISSSGSAPEAPVPAPPCATLFRRGRKAYRPWCSCTSHSQTLAKAQCQSLGARDRYSSTSRTRLPWSRTRSRKTRRAASRRSC